MKDQDPKHRPRKYTGRKRKPLDPDGTMDIYAHIAAVEEGLSRMKLRMGAVEKELLALQEILRKEEEEEDGNAQAG